MSRGLDRTLLIRHLAICLATATAFVLRVELRIGYAALCMVAIAALLNSGVYVLRRWPGLARLALLASPAIGVGSWSVLIALTNGVSSPFIAGLWLEIALSAMALAPPGVLAVTGGAVIALWSQQVWLGFSGAESPLALQTAFLAAMGGVTFAVMRRWCGVRDELSRQSADLGSRLHELERELEDGRILSQVGKKAARLAHGQKNAVHSLRGFVSLIEPALEKSGGSPLDRKALAGLRLAIDHLEELARLTLKPEQGGEDTGERPCVCDASRCLEQAVQGVSAAHPHVHWVTTSDGTTPQLQIPPAELEEVLVVLLHNAVEAMGGRGTGSVEMCSTEGGCRISIRDSGTGVSPHELSCMFRPGYTTKREGSGYGLFLAREIISERGGQLTAGAALDGGAIFELAFPPAAGGTAPGGGAEAKVH